jgi:hypothetical protein
MRNNVNHIISGIDTGLKNFDFQMGNLGSFQPADEFFGLAAEHRTANDFNPAFFGISDIGFDKHWYSSLFAIFLRITKLTA